jgi:hypothetical protein
MYLSPGSGGRESDKIIVLFVERCLKKVKFVLFEGAFKFETLLSYKLPINLWK